LKTLISEIVNVYITMRIVSLYIIPID